MITGDKEIYLHSHCTYGASFDHGHYTKHFDLSLVSGQYAVFLCRFIKEWRKNPHWSFSCSLALIIPLNDLQEELGGLQEANVLQNQLQTGKIEKPSILSAVKNSGTIDITLAEGEDDSIEIARALDETHQTTVFSDKRRQQGTQTMPVTDFLVHRRKAYSDEERL